MNPTQPAKRAWLAWLLLGLLVPYVAWQARLPAVAKILWIDVVSEASLVVIALLALGLLLRRPDAASASRWLTAGFSLLLFASICDLFDEFVDQPHWFAHVFEDLFQLVGYGALLAGIWHWNRDNRRLRDELQTRVVTDFLTGAMNRRGFIEKFEQEVGRASRAHAPLALVWFDLDHFKQVNDRYGHQHGDEVLRRCAERVRETLRKTDIFARMGGEEFCILMPATTLDGAVAVAEKLRAVFAADDDAEPFRVTASFGVAAFELGDVVEHLLKRADDALYAAKAAGRNRVKTGELLAAPA